MKEYRVYIVNADSSELDKIEHGGFSGYSIQDWNEAKVLPKEAIKFIEIAELYGSVYSLKGFMDAFNLEEDVGINDYIFITNKY